MAPTLFAIKSTFRRALLARDGSPGSSTPSSTGFPFATTFNSSATGTPIPTNNMSTNGTSVAGVVAGAVVAGLALMLGVAYCLYRRERSIRSKRQTIDLTGEIAAGKLADYGEKKVADLNIGPVPLSESSTSTPDGASRPPLNSESTTGRNLDQRPLDPVSSRPPTRATASGLPAHPGALGRMVSQRGLPDTRPWPPSILRRPPNGSEVRPSATNVVRSTRFQDLSPPPRHLHLVGEPALSSPPSTPGRLTPQIPSSRDTPEEGPTASAEISIITDNLPPGIDVHSSVPATPAPAYSPSPPYLLTDLPPLPITPLSTAALPQASPMNPVAAPSTGDGQPPAPDQETINIPIRESLLPSLVSPHSPIHEKPETSANMGIPSRSSSIRELSSSGRPSRAPSPSVHTPVPLPPPSALSAISRSFSVHRSTSIASPLTVRAGLPTSPRPVRMPSSTPRSSKSGSGHEATLTRSASAHEVRKHRESGSGDSNAAMHGAMLWRHPTAHTPRS